jgi:hypothetical protein
MSKTRRRGYLASTAPKLRPRCCDGDIYLRTGPGSRRMEDEAEIAAYIGGR